MDAWKMGFSFGEQFWPILRDKLAVSFKEWVCFSTLWVKTMYINKPPITNDEEFSPLTSGFCCCKKHPFYQRQLNQPTQNAKRRLSSGNRPAREDVDLWLGKRSASVASSDSRIEKKPPLLLKPSKKHIANMTKTWCQQVFVENSEKHVNQQMKDCVIKQSSEDLNTGNKGMNRMER